MIGATNDNTPAEQAQKITDCADCEGLGFMWILGDFIPCPSCNTAAHAEAMGKEAGDGFGGAG